MSTTNGLAAAGTTVTWNSIPSKYESQELKKKLKEKIELLRAHQRIQRKLIQDISEIQERLAVYENNTIYWNERFISS